jgi:hypothetical protein
MMPLFITFTAGDAKLAGAEVRNAFENLYEVL